MSGYFRIRLQERKNKKQTMQFIKFVIDFNDIYEAMHDLLMSKNYNDDNFRCYRVDFIEITKYN